MSDADFILDNLALDWVVHCLLFVIVINLSLSSVPRDCGEQLLLPTENNHWLWLPAQLAINFNSIFYPQLTLILSSIYPPIGHCDDNYGFDEWARRSDQHVLSFPNLAKHVSGVALVWHCSAFSHTCLPTPHWYFRPGKRAKQGEGGRRHNLLNTGIRMEGNAGLLRWEDSICDKNLNTHIIKGLCWNQTLIWGKATNIPVWIWYKQEQDDDGRGMKGKIP